MKLLRTLAFPLFLLAAVGHAEDGFVPLFNGRDLSGWVNVNCAPETFRATNGVLYCTGVPTGELRTPRMYQNFILEVEWRHLRPKGNAGVFVWADALTAPGQPFIRGVEVQVLDGQEGPGHTSDGDIFPIHGAKMTPENGRGGDRAFPTEKRMKPSPEWNHYRVECLDGNISLAVNGKVVTRGHQASPSKGYLCLESEGSPIEFRNLRVKELPAKEALAPEQIANPAEGFQPLYTGVDLRGWQTDAAVTQAWKVGDWILKCPTTTEAPPLVSAREFGDGVFVLDWRWTDKARPGDWTKLVRLRARDLSEELKGAVKPDANPEKPAGQWNRAIFNLRGNRLTISVNGKSFVDGLTLAGIPPRGQLILMPPAVPSDLANLFVKALD
jgi:hypothetical protein